MSELIDRTIEDVIKQAKMHNRKSDSKLIMRAYKYALENHGDQKRKSGEPYIIHPIQVAYTLAELGLDDATICAALMHDLAEDTAVTLNDISSEFSPEIAEMVNGVTKLAKIKYVSAEEQQVENYRKMFLAMGKDIRVILIKLADRLHNIRTLKFLKRDRQIAIAQETIDLYAPLANRLGVFSMKWELEDQAFKYLYPEEYREIVEGIAKKREERLKFIDQIVDEIKINLKKEKIVCEITGRAKHLYSIYRKMKRDNKTLDQIYDLFALRILVNSVKDCYAALGVVHELYTPMPGRFKDYIAVPKPNMYQSLHTTLLGPNGTPFEVQIRTYNMHRIAEFGIAAHWAYKEQSFLHGKKENVTVKEDKLAWLRESLEWQKDMQNPDEFMSTLKTELVEDSVYVFTPKGQIKTLPKGSTPIDFAYSIHADIGNKMVGAKINSKMMPIITPLHNGDIVDIMTNDNSKGPSRDWLKFVKSSSAKTKIQQWFKKNERDLNIERGKEIIARELKRIRLNSDELLTSKNIESTLQKYSFKTIDDMYAAVGFGSITATKVLSKILEEYRKTKPNTEIEEKIEELHTRHNINENVSKTGIIVKGIDNCLVKLSKCCNPVPGDEIIGYITRGRGVTVHTKDCVNVKDLFKEEERIIDVYWAQESTNKSYNVEMTVYANDREELLGDIMRTAQQDNSKIVGVQAKSNKEKIVMVELTLEVKDIEAVNKIQRELGKIDSVYDVKRKK
ncbi:MAG: bifunctional (p)ppGpp synthetase/guanosine-3',5'-bis(diphosphate) 3'-pyrophosphohydrolase [Clostridiales bacterium]|jgi:relA/spoT family protein|nr:bifunctional (p)ppGpp synthetase/guanosine-3',5'-bis(diphosphate) 3'-pyrophosphohydrolase [Clostridiales bacterium]MBF0926515.1 bifunctional (p)ppGpp synthetase/guanosine-3',5'-bis(diphosphate) 3'-pyrophosphohydrolase [Clostridiales bacterium]MBF0979263.1 bifunctional (p)ppGpp synthetase/guanosine-3',5'-bis(diphosphate) 3'-pyrophosphohydrolase [Clostridiales bacterium]